MSSLIDGSWDSTPWLVRLSDWSNHIGRPSIRMVWRDIAGDFLKYHQRPLNNLLHAITTPMALVGMLGLLRLVTEWFWVPCVVYLVTIWFMVPVVVFLPTVLVLAMGAACAVSLDFGVWENLGLLVVGYVGQELAHLFVGEKTYQSSYQRSSGWIKSLLIHTLYQVPLVVLACIRRKTSPLRLLVQRKALHFYRLEDVTALQDLNVIREWATEEHPQPKQSVHYWPDDMDGSPKDAFDRISVHRGLMQNIQQHHGPGYTVIPVFGMNELYLTGPPKQRTSDTVFYMSHVDGPFSVFPGARLYRCMVAASPNGSVTTHFPMTGAEYRKPESFRLETGDTLAFDFNRELHHITREEASAPQGPRVNLKLHFVAYPKNLSWYGNLLARWTTAYDIQARGLFLQTIDPDRWMARLKTTWVLTSTKAYEYIVRYLGWANLAYIACMALIAVAMQSGIWFLFATSFVHYLIYIATLRERRGIAFGLFVRDAVFFKAVSFAQLFGYYALQLSGQPLGPVIVSIGLVGFGFAIAGAAGLRLGKRRTYFSAELGLDAPKWVERFPYGLIPHPMIVGSLWGLGGMAVLVKGSGSFSWLLAVHVAFYLWVLVHESIIRSVSHHNRQVIS